MPLAKEEERRLIVNCQVAKLKGDQTVYNAAFAELCKGHEPALMGIARRVTRSREDAEEVRDDAYRELNDYLPKIDPDQGCFGLLRQFALWRAADKYARSLHLKYEESFDPDLHTEPPASEQPADERLISLREARISLAKAGRLAALACGRDAGAPNERIVFLFNKTLGFRPTKLAAAEFCGRRLGTDYEVRGVRWAAIEPELEREWMAETSLEPELTASMFAPLRRDLEMVLGEYPLHGSTRSLYRNSPLWELQIAQGQLREYFRSEPPTEDIRRWCVNVEKRLVKLATKS